MNAKKFLLSVSTLAALGTVGLGVASSAFAYQGDYTKKGPNYTEERHTAMLEAFEKNNYGAWKELMQGRGRVTQVVNQDNFAQFAQAHKLAQEGNYAEANTIREKLGLRTNNGQKVGAGFGQGMQKNGRTAN